jgi:hypothetical protein
VIVERSRIPTTLHQESDTRHVISERMRITCARAVQFQTDAPPFSLSLDMWTIAPRNPLAASSRRARVWD